MRCMENIALPTPVEWVAELMRNRVQPGAWVVDATAGNGNDTLLLAQAVGARGRVFAFDVQAAALTATRALLKESGAPGVCTLIHAGHECLADHLPTEARGQLAAVMFNLGWLPGHDKACITRAQTTLPALQTALEWLMPGGLITVVVYPNHGPDEAQAVAEWVCSLSARTFEARNLRSHYRWGRSPEAWAIRKRVR
jgi:SAM-dependent methyltransferase